MGRDRGTAAARGTKGETAPPGTQGSGRVEGTIYGRDFKLLALACATLLSGIADPGSFGGQHGPGVQHRMGGSVGQQPADLGGGVDGRSLSPSAMKLSTAEAVRNLLPRIAGRRRGVQPKTRPSSDMSSSGVPAKAVED